ncbi:hypothetical protein MYSE111917_05515 [Mycobacterium senriense]|nr:hypothetical protein [Mycobacterium senriense]
MTDSDSDRRVQPALVALPWLWVGLPFGYGVVELVTKATQLFSN